MPVPATSSPPAAAGLAKVGATLTCSTGTWTNTPTSYTYQWQTSGDNVTFGSNSATAATYTLGHADSRNWFRCQVTAHNASGASTPSSSNSLGPVAYYPTLISGPQQSLGMGPDPELTGY